MKNLKLICLLILLGVYASCSNDDDDNDILIGTYTETSPVNGRTQLRFELGKIVIKSEPGHVNQTKFFYELKDNTIKLTPISNSMYSSELEFYIINESKFEIQNLHAHIPEAPTSYMTFEK